MDTLSQKRSRGKTERKGEPLQEVAEQSCRGQDTSGRREGGGPVLT